MISRRPEPRPAGVQGLVDHAVEAAGAWDGLEPDDFAEAGPLRRADSWHVPLLRRSSRSGLLRAFRHRLVAMRYSQVRSDERPSNQATPVDAARRASRSDPRVSLMEPSIR